MKNCITIVLLLVSCVAWGQRDSLSVGYISINGGVTRPVGIFALPAKTTGVTTTPSKSNVGFGDSAGGFAMIGETITILVGVPIAHSHFGIAGKLGYTTNAFDIDRLINNMNNDYNAQQNGMVYTGSVKGRYTEYSIMPGGFVTFKHPKVSIDFSLLIGAAICQTPDVKITGSTNSLPSTIQEYKTASEVSVEADLNFGLRYTVTDNLCIMGNLAYMHTLATFTIKDDYTYQSGSGPATETLSYNTVVNISMFTLTLGVGYQFGK